MLKGVKAKLYVEITKAAQSHGEQSEPDMEIGDLQDALSYALKYVPVERISTLRRELEDQLEWGE